LIKTFNWKWFFCHALPNPSLQANLLDVFRSTQQPACVYSVADCQRELFRQELNKRLLSPDNQHEYAYMVFFSVTEKHSD